MPRHRMRERRREQERLRRIVPPGVAFGGDFTFTPFLHRRRPRRGDVFWSKGVQRDFARFASYRMFLAGRK